MSVHIAKEKSVVVGVEMTGGKATVALIDKQGWVHQRCTAKTLRGRPALATLEAYLRAVDTILTYAQTEELTINGIGMSIPGSLDRSARRPVLVPLLPSLNNFPLCDFFEARYQLPTTLSADVDAAMLGEHRLGAGRGFQRPLFLTVNAVVGAAFLGDCQLEQKQLQYIGHVSHLPVSTNGPRCSCGKRGCINSLVSIDALQRMVQRALRRGDETSLTLRFQNHEYFSPQLLAEEAERGDSVALQIYGELGRWLGMALSKYVTLFRPDVLILGGEVVGDNALLLTIVRNVLSTQHGTGNPVELVSACLGRDAALIGAALAQDRYSYSHAH
ncbi:MAG TPA: ROK family protein [Ktedonobacteraceae bacterium]|nr:ROK family protein [Ktedonobacteraceae bacterium]